MGKKKLIIITLIILQIILIKVFPQYWLIFISICVPMFVKILNDFESEVVSKNSIKVNKSNDLDTHFLFNAISTIMYYCRTDGNKARELLLALGDYLRYYLSQSEDDTKLSNEFKVLKGYLKIQQSRFGEKIDYEIKSLEDDFLIKKGFLIEITYIALKEGLLKSKVGGKITVESKVDKKDLIIILIHDGDIAKYIDEYKNTYGEKFGYKLDGISKDGDKTELSLKIPINNVL
ncbi:histidine kinase [Clostridium intestinale]|uniref:histidine kinase n=1 Tax=Clostridium intestinale TaxID=36845 RepID=UPI0028E50871|nr:histidine kinase [Clostridium intestinale]